MRPMRHDSRSMFVEGLSREMKFAEANAQMIALRDLGNAIRQERRLLERALDRFSKMETTTNIDRIYQPTEVGIA